MRQLNLLSYNVQAGIHSRQYSDYFTNSWKHLLPHPERLINLTHIAQLLRQFDVVGLQEVDAGSLRSAYIDQVHYLARHGAQKSATDAIAKWYAMLRKVEQLENQVLTQRRQVSQLAIELMK